MNLFSYVKSRLSILDIIGEYTKLKRAGGYWKAHCPFHHEKTASFTVSPDKGIFYCFGCHINGDLISFIAKIENCTQLEAVQHLVERHQIEIPESVMQQKSAVSPDEKNRYFTLCETVAIWCHETLKKSPSTLRYVHERGFNTNTIDHFKVGYFPAGPQQLKALISHMASQSILIDDLVHAHIISEGKHGHYSPFEDRIIFPIKDHLGRYCGFGGRVFKPADKRAKYYNSRENSFFSKGSLLFGFNLAKKKIQETQELFLVEGYTDCLAMVQHGFTNTVATLGTACTTEHLKALSRHAHQLYILYDGDAAGQKAILRLTELCWKSNIELLVIGLPKNEDPASLLQKGADLHDLKIKAKDIFTFFVDTLGHNFADKPLNKKMQLVDKLLSTIKNIPEPFKRDIILQKAADRLNIPFDSLRSGLSVDTPPKGQTRKKQLQQGQSAPANHSNDARITLEKRILFAILNNVSLLCENNEDYLITCLPAPAPSILKKLKNLKEQKPTETLSFSHLFELLDQEERQYATMMLLQLDETIEPQSFAQLVAQLQKKTWKTVVRAMKTKLAQAQQQNNTQEIAKILDNFSRLKQKLLRTNYGTNQNE